MPTRVDARGGRPQGRWSRRRRDDRRHADPRHPGRVVSPAAEEEQTMPDDRWQELSDAECRRLLGERHLGRLALVDADGPVIFPVNYAFAAGTVVFRTDPGGKLDAVAGGAV